ncbi:MAG: UDP-N-acetylmuramoyl-L-alanine--D-glutamate ligase [Candidatus Puniceispirillaceae bacterium]
MTMRHKTSFQHIAIFGAGLSGRAAYARARDLGISCVIDDDHMTAYETIADHDFISFQEWDFSQIEALILSPGIAHHHPAPHPVAKMAQDHQVEIISEVEFGLRTGNWGEMIIITGTNGKSTTTALTGHILKEAGLSVGIGGNLGTPLCALPEQTDGFTVLELSSYQLETTPSLAPKVSALLNITPDHLDRHGGLDGYISAKKQSLITIRPDGLALIGDEGPIMKDVLAWAHDNLSCQIEAISGKSLPSSLCQNPYLAGLHNQQNIAFALAIASHFGVSGDIMEQAITSFIGLPHRLQPVGSHNGTPFINDSKATNGDATAKALSAFESIIWLAGGRAKAEGLSACTPYFHHIRKAHFFGESAKAFYEQAKDHITCHYHDTLDEAFAHATDMLDGTEVVLLSPAAASFDQFANFGMRGDHFAKLTKAFIDTHHQPLKEVSHAR